MHYKYFSFDISINNFDIITVDFTSVMSESRRLLYIYIYIG